MNTGAEARRGRGRDGVMPFLTSCSHYVHAKQKTKCQKSVLSLSAVQPIFYSISLKKVGKTQ